MKKRIRIKMADVIIMSVVLILATIAAFIVSAKPADIDDQQPATEVLSYDGFSGTTIGIKTGSAFESITLEKFPDKEHLYFDSDSDLIAALKTGKIDGFLTDEPVAYMMHMEQADIDYMHTPIIEDNYCFGFAKDTERSKMLRTQFNELLAEERANGGLERLKEKWFSTDESSKYVDISGLTGENGSITVTGLTDNVPFVYTSSNQEQGYAVELVTMFARKYGYSVEYELGNVTSCLAGMASGKYDICAGSFSVTEERRQSMDFSDAVYSGGVVLVFRSEDKSAISSNEKKISDYDGKVIGVQTGTVFDEMIGEKLPNSEIRYYNTYTDLIASLKEGIIDAFATDEPMAKVMMAEDKSLGYLDDYLDDYSFAFAFPKTSEGEALCGEFNEYLNKAKSDGTLEEIEGIWFDPDETNKVIPDPDELPDDRGELHLALESAFAPFCYVKDNAVVGYEVDIAYRFCKEYGYGLDLVDMNFDAVIPSIASGKCDFGCSGISETEERRESVNFSVSDYYGGSVLAVRAEDIINSAASYSTAPKEETGTSWVETITSSFNKNFIREDRYKLILEGIKTTCIITILSVIFGSLIAFLICMFRRLDSVLSNKMANLYVKLLQGTPMVVLLMILYYVVFGRSGIDAIWVAVIGFSLNFAAYVSEILRSGIDSIDGGQREAALALGFSENQAFFRFIFPQAAVRQLSVYRGEIISLLKNTSIVGYIAIQDLTKMSDIIRSRTYEAFFPLIVTAVIYFILAWVIALILKIILRQLDPKTRKRGRI